MKSNNNNILTRLRHATAVANKVKKFHEALNQRMEGKYSPFYMTLVATVLIGVVSSIILFLPNYLGVAADGSADETMRAASIFYIEDQNEDIYNNYFIKTYSRIAMEGEEVSGQISSHILMIKAAAAVDDIFTGDSYFDIRFLGFLYLILYLPAVFYVIYEACLRVKRFSEAFTIIAVGAIIFSDVGYITYFNSFYPEALWFITLLYCIGSAMSFQRRRSAYLDTASLMIFFLSALVLVSSRRQCIILGFIFATYCIRLIFVRRRILWSLCCIVVAFLLSGTAVLGFLYLSPDFDESSKFHAMTRGVLFETANPASTLEEFGIDQSYEILADASTYDYLPLVRTGDESLYHGFLDQYDTLDIAAYYLRHPGSMLGMMDVAVNSGMNIRRALCGNYEKSVGFPKRAKTLFWSGWSTFKATSAPRTVGYLFVLTVMILLLFRKGYSFRPLEDRRSTVILDMLITVLIVILAEAALIIICSGDAEMIQHTFIIGFGIDIMTYYTFAELLHKIKIT